MHLNHCSVRELIQHVPDPNPPPCSCLKTAACQAAPHLPFALFSGHSAWKPFKPPSPTFLSISALAIQGQAPLVPQDSVAGFSSSGLPIPVLGPSNPSWSPCHLHFSKPSSHPAFPKLTNLPPSNRIPRASGIPLLTSCPLLQQAPFMLGALPPTPNAFVHFWPRCWATSKECPLPFRLI